MATETQTQMKIVAGSRVVVANRNDVNSKWSSRLYVNCVGDALGDATLTAAKHATEAGVRRWARKALEG
jgi:hypothetical protein